MSKLTAGISALLCLLFVSCQKEISETRPENNTSSIVGNYKFIKGEVKSVATTIIEDDGDVMETITYSHYITKNNKGTVKIDGQKFTAQQMGYTVDTTIRVASYYNREKLDSSATPFTFNVPEYDGTATYIQVGADSLYFAGGSFLTGSGSQMVGAANGAKFKIEGNKLIITNNLNSTERGSMSGVAYILKTEGQSVMTLQKL